MTWNLPVKRVGFEKEGSFARETLITRWPRILADTTAALASPTAPTSELARSQAAEIKAAVDAILDEVKHNKTPARLEADGCEHREVYNAQVEAFEKNGQGWEQLPWLWAECYLYRRLRSIFALRSEWKEFDPYAGSKDGTFASSLTAVLRITKAQLELKPTAETLQTAFHSMLQMSLWGNATDLSLLAGSTSMADIAKLQERGDAEKKFILRNDEEKVWAWLNGSGKGGVDFVLDNAGFELFTDMVFADFLVSHIPSVTHATFHPKSIPWFVSDVLPRDFDWLLSTLAEPSSLFDGLSSEDTQVLQALGARWSIFVADGKFRVQPSEKDEGDFWVRGEEYQRLPELAPKLAKTLSQSRLVIFKGDLNYRKLTADAEWPATAPFDEVLGPINGLFPILSLRTNKAEVIVGLAEGVEERVEKEDPKWRVNGKWAVVSFAPSSSQ